MSAEPVLFVVLALDVAGGFYGTIGATAAAVIALVLAVVALALLLRARVP